MLSYEAQQKIEEIVKESLPASTANALKEYLEEAKSTEGQLQVCKEQLVERGDSIVALEENIRQLTKAKEALEKLVNKEDYLNIMEEDLKDERRNLDKAKLEIRLEMMKERQKTMDDLVSKVFGHPAVTVTNRNKGFAVDGGGGCPGTVQSNYTDETETTVEGKQ